MSSAVDFGARKEAFFSELKTLLAKYQMRIVTLLEKEEREGILLKIFPSIYFIDDSLSYKKKELVDKKN